MNHEIDRLQAALDLSERRRIKAETRAVKLALALRRIDLVLMNPKRGALADIVDIVEAVREYV